MTKFFLLLGKNDGTMWRKSSPFPFSNFEKREHSTAFSDFSTILSDIFPILSDVFKISREEIRKMSDKITQTTRHFF